MNTAIEIDFLICRSLYILPPGQIRLRLQKFAGTHTIRQSA